MFHVEALNDHIKVEPFITRSQHHWSGQSADIVTSEELGGVRCGNKGVAV